MSTDPNPDPGGCLIVAFVILMIVVAIVAVPLLFGLAWRLFAVAAGIGQ